MDDLKTKLYTLHGAYNMLTTGRGKRKSGQATFVGYHGRHRSRPDHILMTFNFYHDLLSTDIQPSNERIADHCSITACFKVRQSGLTGADINLEPPQHACLSRWLSEAHIDEVES